MFLVAKETATAATRVFKLFTNKQRCALFVAVAMMAITGGLTTVPPLVIGHLVDDILQSQYESFAPAIPFLFMILAAVVIKELITVCRKWLIEETCTRIQKAQTIGLVSHLLRVDLSLFSQQRVGSLNGRVHRSIEGLTRLVKLGFLDFFPAAFVAAFSLVVALTRQPIIGGVMTVSVVAGILLVLWQVSSQRGIRIGLLRNREAMDGTVVETLGGIETVRASNTEEVEISKVERVAEQLRQREIRHHIQMAFFDAGKFLSESGFHIITISISIWLAIQGQVTVGEVLTYSMLYLSVAAPLRELHRILDEAHESTLRVGDLFALIDDFPQDRSFVEPVNAPLIDMSGTVPVFEFQDVHFVYPNSNGDGHVLNGLTFKVEKGTKVGCVGKSGSGKSTAAKLILRLFERVSGDIRFGGVPIDKVSRKQIAKHVGYVSQSPFVFSGTFRDNICYGNCDASLEEVMQAAKAAQLHNDIERLGGYDAQVAEQGKNLSGGQRQRLVLARLFLRQPEVIILDEATASLDNVTEASVQNALEALTRGRTVFVIAHRLNTIKDADKILVIEDGVLAEVGTYSNLLNSKGALAEFAKAG
jgi:ATP-binding cassette subfamily B protein